jgi:sensor c-di-GMP phosphodiesterase-like protein
MNHLKTIRARHILATLLLPLVLLIGIYTLALHESQTIENNDHQVIGTQTAIAAEKSVKNTLAVLSQLNLGLIKSSCAPDYLAILSQIEYYSEDIKEFGIYNIHGILTCTSRYRNTDERHGKTFSTSTYGNTTVQVIEPDADILHHRQWTNKGIYKIKLGFYDALLSPSQWINRDSLRNYSAAIYDRQSNALITKVGDFNFPKILPQNNNLVLVLTEHFNIYVAGRGESYSELIFNNEGYSAAIFTIIIFVSSLLTVSTIHAYLSTENQLALIANYYPQRIKINYRPIIDIKTATTVGCEVIAGGLKRNNVKISDSEYVAVEQHASRRARKAMCSITDIAIKTATKELKEWLRADYNNYITIRISNPDIEDTAIVLRIKAIIRDAGILPNQILFMVSSTATNISRASAQRLSDLHTLGCLIWLEDFGVGNTNLGRLREFPVSGIKLDKSWVQGLDDSQVARVALIAQFTLFVEQQGLGLIVDGVTEEHTLRTLVRLSVVNLQGNLFCEQVTSEIFLKYAKQIN